jgi:hypothetical protein
MSGPLRDLSFVAMPPVPGPRAPPATASTEASTRSMRLSSFASGLL